MTGQIQQHLMRANAAEMLRVGKARRLSAPVPPAGRGRRATIVLWAANGK
jgi:hypothetical protein